jgi:hypothetical protein
MGFADWLRRRQPSRVEPDSVWLTAAGRLAGLRERVARHAAEAQVVVLAHFPRTLDAVAEALGETGLERARSERDLASRLTSPRAGSVSLALVGELPAEAPQSRGPAEGRVSFLVAERHPLRTEDERVERLAAGLPYPTSVRFHLALDDPLFERFVDEQVKGLLMGLGMGENDELSHPLIAGAVERAQREIASRAAPAVEAESVGAESVEDWLGAIEPK